jgi:hypothetical protein
VIFAHLDSIPHSYSSRDQQCQNVIVISGGVYALSCESVCSSGGDQYEGVGSLPGMLALFKVRGARNGGNYGGHDPVQMPVQVRDTDQPDARGTQDVPQVPQVQEARVEEEHRVHLQAERVTPAN